MNCTKYTNLLLLKSDVGCALDKCGEGGGAAELYGRHCLAVGSEQLWGALQLALAAAQWKDFLVLCALIAEAERAHQPVPLEALERRAQQRHHQLVWVAHF